MVVTTIPVTKTPRSLLLPPCWRRCTFSALFEANCTHSSPRAASQLVMAMAVEEQESVVVKVLVLEDDFELCCALLQALQ